MKSKALNGKIPARAFLFIKLIKHNNYDILRHERREDVICLKYTLHKEMKK